MTGDIATNSMALAVIPKNELARMAQKEAAKAKRLERTVNGICIGGLSVVGVVIGGLAALGAAPIVVPILIWVGFASIVGSIAPALSFQSAADRSSERQNQAIKRRADRLTGAAKLELLHAAADGLIRVGLYLPVSSEDETPKKIGVEAMMAIIDTFGRKKLGLTALVLEGDGKSVDWMDRRHLSKLYLEFSVAKLPKAILDSLRSELPPADSVIIAPVAREPEKILPPINFPLLPS